VSKLELHKIKSVSEPPGTDFAESDVESLVHSSTSYKKTYDNLIIPQTQKKSRENCKDYATNLFSVIKDSLDIVVVLDYYGLTVDKKGFARCPFHQEKTPSFKINREKNTYHCFGCGEHGTVIDFVMRYFHITNIEAVTKLNDDFRLNLPIYEKINAEKYKHLLKEIQKRKQNKKIINGFDQWEKQAFSNLCDYYRKLRADTEGVIFTEDCPQLQEHIIKLAELPFVDYLINSMIDNMRNFKARAKFYQDHRGAVIEIESRQHLLND
jgi:hypothetical protein